MQKLSLGLALAAATLLSQAAYAQCAVSPGGGTNLGAADDGLFSANLSFAFTWPGGTSTSAIDVDTNGRIFPGGSGDTSDFTDSLGEFAGDPHATIALYWADMDSGNHAPTSNVTLTDNGSTQAYIEYNDWSYFNAAGAKFQAQIELNSDGSFALIYGPNWTSLDNNPGIVGTTAGNGATLPLEADLNSGATVSTPVGNPNLFEEFSGGGTDNLDLEDSRLDWFPDGLGGYVVVPTVCNFVIATSQEVGPSCNFGTDIAYQWIPSGTGYIVIDATGTASFDAINLGTSVGAGDDTIFTANLGAAFQMPDGSAYTQLDIDSNGKLNVVGTDGSDFTPTAAEFLSAPSIAPFHGDLSPNISGDLTFYTDGATQANVTWTDVPEFGETNAITLQLQLDLTGTGIFTVIYRDIADYDLVGDTLLIGTSDGTGTGIAYDISASGGGFAGPPSAYEFFDASTPQDLQALGGPSSSIDYAALNRPVTGQVYQTVANGIPATAASGFILLGFQRWPAGIPGLTTPDGFALLTLLDPTIDSSCVLTHQIGYGSAPLSPAEWTPGSGSATYDLDLTTAGTSAIDLPVNLQMIFIDPGAPWGGGAFPLITSNGIEAVGGSL